MVQINELEKQAIIFQARVELIKRYAQNGDILNWGKILFPQKFSLPFCGELHNYFISIKDSPFTNTEAPRYHAKTIIKCFLIPLYTALETPEKYQHYLNVQSTSTKATAVNIAIKDELENNELLKYIYGDQTTQDKWTEKQFVLKNGVIFTAIGSGESMRGIQYKNKRPDYIICDDLYNEDDINNIRATQKVNSWFWGSLYPARARAKNCCIHIQGTAINKADLLEELKKKDRWQSRTFKAVKDFKRKKVLWPELNSFEDLMADKEDMGSVIFFREMQNERRDEESSIIKESWLKFYDGQDWVKPEGERFVAKILGVDPSIGEKETDDYTGLATVYKTKVIDGSAYNYYIHGIEAEHLSLDQRVRKIERMHNRENYTEARIEAIAGFKDFAAEVRRRVNINVKTIPHVKDKITNLENKSSTFENGRVYINKRIPQKQRNELIEQLTNNYPVNDDMRDAVLLTIDKSSSINVNKILDDINKINKDVPTLEALSGEGEL